MFFCCFLLDVIIDKQLIDVCKHSPAAPPMTIQIIIRVVFLWGPNVSMRAGGVLAALITA